MKKKFVRRSKLSFDSKKLAAKWPLFAVVIAVLFLVSAGAVWIFIRTSPLEVYKTETYSLLVPRTFKSLKDEYDNGMTKHPFFRNGKQDNRKSTDIDIVVAVWKSSVTESQQAVQKFDDDWQSGAYKTKSDFHEFRNISKRIINGHEARQFEGYLSSSKAHISDGLYVYTDDAIYLVAIYNYNSASTDMQSLVPDILNSFYVK